MLLLRCLFGSKQILVPYQCIFRDMRNLGLLLRQWPGVLLLSVLHISCIHDVLFLCRWPWLLVHFFCPVLHLRHRHTMLRGHHWQFLQLLLAVRVFGRLLQFKWWVLL